jgi:glutaconate CoA-transferase subunit A
VDAVVVAPWGAHPTSCYPRYTFDVWHLFDYIDAAKDDTRFHDYVQRHVFDCPTIDQYAESVGGTSAMERIRL